MENENKPSRPIVLLMLDGWGVSPARENNAIRLANINNFKDLVAHYPATVLLDAQKQNTFGYKVLGSSCLDGKSKVSLSKIIAAAGLKQLKIAETERFALITNFFNGNEKPFKGEDQVLIPSIPAADNKSRAQSATSAVVKKMLAAIKSDKYDFILTSWANIENVSLSGEIKPVIKAVEFIDKNLKKIVEAVSGKKGVLIIASIHGYAEEVFNVQTNLPNKEFTVNPLPFLIIGPDFMGRTIGLSEASANDLSLLEPAGSLIDIAPTILQIMGLKSSPDFEGKSLI